MYLPSVEASSVRALKHKSAVSAPRSEAQQQQQQFPSAARCGVADVGCGGCSRKQNIDPANVLSDSMVSPFPFDVGIKRSASGEAAAAAAKKQKTSPLAAYQQAQEHLRSQNARHVCMLTASSQPVSLLTLVQATCCIYLTAMQSLDAVMLAQLL